MLNHGTDKFLRYNPTKLPLVFQHKYYDVKPFAEDYFVYFWLGTPNLIPSTHDNDPCSPRHHHLDGATRAEREKCDYDDVNGILYSIARFVEMLCTCGLLHCKASVFFVTCVDSLIGCGSLSRLLFEVYLNLFNFGLKACYVSVWKISFDYNRKKLSERLSIKRVKKSVKIINIATYISINNI